jgi:Spy/CpxP family protein refolding chaperone
MNRWLPAMVVSGLLISLPFSLVHAEEGSPADMGGMGFHREFGKGHDGLDLSKDQKSKLHDLMEQERNAIKPLFRKLRDLRIKLHDQIEDKAGDSDIKATLGEMKENHKALREQMEKFKSQKDTIMTPTQQAKMELWHHMKGHGHEGMREDGRDGKGWGHVRHGDGDGRDGHEHSDNDD